MTQEIYWVSIDGRRYRITATNWENFRIYLTLHFPDGIRTEELGFFQIPDELEDELYTRYVPDEVVEFLEENRTSIIEDLEDF